jgi:hypothetical protein
MTKPAGSIMSMRQDSFAWIFNMLHEHVRIAGWDLLEPMSILCNFHNQPLEVQAGGNHSPPV